jgi:hypothetical protein
MKGDSSWMYGPCYVNKRKNPVFVKGVESVFYYAFGIQKNISMSIPRASTASYEYQRQVLNIGDRLF